MKKFNPVLPLFVFVGFVAMTIGWLRERATSNELRAEVQRLKNHLGPDYFWQMYHADPDRSAFANDPLDSVNTQTKELFHALLQQPEVWKNGLVYYLGLERVRETLDPEITMQVWWRGESADSDGNRHYVYLADRERSSHSPFASAFIVTDMKHQVIAWQGTDIDGPKVSHIELLGRGSQLP